MSPAGTTLVYEYFYCAGVAGGSFSCPAGGAYAVRATPRSTASGGQVGSQTVAYYDRLGRVIRAMAEGFGGTPSLVDTVYDGRGRVAQTSRPYFSGDPVYWSVTSYDVLDRPLTVTLPDSTTAQTAYDGLTTTETDVAGRTRVTVKNSQGWVLSASGQATQAVSYDALGNIKSRDGIATSYLYGSNAGPHAVTRLRNGSTVIASFFYDPNGNMTSATGVTLSGASVARTIAWTSFDQPLSITQGSNTVDFLYGPEHQRIRQVSPVDTSWSFAAAGSFRSEKRMAPGGGESWTTYVAVGGRLVATLEKAVTVPSSAPVARYFLTDHLGSVEQVLDDSGGLGGIAQSLSFDAWGTKRLANWTAGTPATTERRGFTGHEQLDSVGLVHMNGRLYDPLLGRFLSADPGVQFPGNLQNDNRYSYVLNNPLSYTDPSGYFLKGLFKGVAKFFKGALKFVTSRQFLAIVVGIALAVVLGPNGALLAGIGTGAFTGTAAAAIGGFASGYIATGTLKGAVLSAATAAIGAGLTGGIENAGARALADGVAGGTISEISGGDFRQGFFAAGFSSLAAASVTGPRGLPGDFGVQVTARAVVGGTASVIGGGKFANGAYAAAFSYAVARAATVSSRKSGQTADDDMRAWPIVGDVVEAIEWVDKQINKPSWDGGERKGIKPRGAYSEEEGRFDVAQADFTDHSYSRMLERGFTPRQIMDALMFGVRTLQPNGNTRCSYGGVTVIINPQGGIVTCD